MNATAIYDTQATGQATMITRFRKKTSALGRLIMIASGVAMLSLWFAPAASAGVNGEYRYVSSSGSIRVGGKAYKVSKSDLKAVLANKTGHAVIKNGRILIDADSADELVRDALEGTGGKLEISVSGPRSIKIRKAGRFYLGDKNKPVVVRVKGELQGQAIRGKIKYDFNPRISGDKLTLDVPVSGSIAGFGIEGNIRVVCRR